MQSRHVHRHAARDGHVGRLGHRHPRHHGRPTGPTARIDSPGAGTTWGAGQGSRSPGVVRTSTAAALPASALDWAVVLRHCAGADCHEHQIGDYPDTAAGLVHGPRPRRARPDRGAAHRHLLQRPDRGEDRRPRPAHRRRIARRDARRRGGDAQRRGGHGAGHAPGGGRLDQHARRAGSPRRSATRPTGSRRGATGSSGRAASRPRGTGPSRPRSCRSPRGPRRSRSRRRPTSGRTKRSRRSNFGTENRLRTDGRLRPGRGELPALPGGRHHRTGDEREAAPAVDHQHARTGRRCAAPRTAGPRPA